VSTLWNVLVGGVAVILAALGTVQLAHRLAERD
jgi:hypothetical protein